MELVARTLITARDLEHMLSDETAEPKALPLSLLGEITEGFSDKQRIGSGGFAVVYKGKVQNGNVAVKKMSNDFMDENVFHREVQCLMRVKHKNIVRFLGYCADRQGTMVEMYEGKFIMADVHQRLLCFEYLPKGSLRQYITDPSSEPQWRDRFRIIMGICHGLNYLHQKNIVHVDLKPENILLDNNFVAKIADFGLSRCFTKTQSRIITQKITGTLGYMPPEFLNGVITYQFDIFSLGVIIMEILTAEKGSQDVDKVVESWSNLLGQSQSNVQLKQVRLCAKIGIACIDSNPANRLDTQDIINKLHEIESMDEYNETGAITSQQGVRSLSLYPWYSQLAQKVFTVSNEQGYRLNQLRDLNGLHGRLEIKGLENVTSFEEALEANLAGKECLEELKLEWTVVHGLCSPEVEADVLEGLCPPMGLKKLEIRCYSGSRYPDWMVGKQNGGPKELQELDLFTFVKGPAPQIVEAFPHLRVLRLCGSDLYALPSSMKHLTSLKSLTIGHNTNIRSLRTLPRSLEKFDVVYCHRKFIKSCQTVGHPNWQKIEHIPEKTFSEDPSLARMAVEWAAESVLDWWRQTS